MIANWQRGRNQPATGYLTGTQHQALLREAAPALTKYDEDQRKADETRKRVDEEKARAAQGAPPPARSAAIAPPTPPPQGVGKGPGADGLWRGTYRCGANKNAGDLNINVQIHVAGSTVQIARNYIPQNQPGVVNTAQLTAQYDGADSISGGGTEHYSGRRTCQISLTRQ
jgi:hypothetical protein